MESKGLRFDQEMMLLLRSFVRYPLYPLYPRRKKLSRLAEWPTNGQRQQMGELRDIRPKDAIAALERADEQVRASGKGDHSNIKMPNGRIVTFSGRREPIEIGLLKATFRKAGLTEEEFVCLLEGKR